MRPELTFFEWLTLYFWPLVGYGRIVNPSTTCPSGVIDVPVKFELLLLKTVRWHVEITFFEWLTLHFWPLWGYGRTVNPSTTCPRSHWRSCEFELLILKTVRLHRRNNVFWVINPFISDPSGGTEELWTTPQPVPSHWRSCEVSTLYFENCANARRIYVFEWLTLYS